ncbi:MAG: hypothetical protein DDT42_02088 [candidate division WS2 bacterium]|uniref:Uncharacterized protein n=1 Tax=Psychracetigena formicireducens TaxID=2986056 RepID=A0A9E2BIG8_PSYF1|nr:hypothetical protein [Candidatus Psychracetigena formicireducens]
MSVLNTARTFEDLGVAAYSGAGQLLTDVNFLLTAGKIVSIEARHAAWIRYIMNPKTNSFANSEVVDNNGLEISKSPSQVLSAAGGFVRNRIIFSGLPTS